MEKFSRPGLEITKDPGRPDLGISGNFSALITGRRIESPTSEQLRDIAYHYLEAAAWLREREDSNVSE